MQKLRREDNFKLTTGNESLYEISNADVLTVVNFATSEKSNYQDYSVLESQHPYTQSD
jgi:hypothetical protein